MKVDFERLHQSIWSNGGCDNFPPDKWRITAFETSNGETGIPWDRITFELRSKDEDPDFAAT